MIKHLSPIATLGFVLAGGAAHAQGQPKPAFDWGGMPPLTIEMVRRGAALGVEPTATDVENLRKCPDMHPAEPMDMKPEDVARAHALHITAGALWLRENDAAIARCLAAQ
jgi:hypothetical protein